MDSPLALLGLVTLVNRASLPRLEAALSEWDFRVFRLDGTDVHDQATFLVQAERDLPMPIGFQPKNWSGLMDGLWGGLSEIADEMVGIVWTHADNMLHGGLSDLLKVVDCLTDLARQVYNPSETGFPHEMSINVFLVGEGSNFPQFRVP